MAKYLVLIYGDEQRWENMSEQEEQRLMAGHRDLAEAAGSAILDTRELEPASAATSLRAGADGRPTPTDGPFLEAKEAVGGYYLLEASDLDEAMALASRLYEASADHGGVEIRPLREG